MKSLLTAFMDDVFLSWHVTSPCFIPQRSLRLCVKSVTGSVLALALLTLSVPAAEVEWPEITQTALPWTRWWWHGSAVDEENLTRCLEQYSAAGLGGVEITCIYGVKGTKDRQLRYLSPKWVEAVAQAANEAKRLGMGVDLPPGSGWRMGGPRVPLEDSNSVLMLAKPQAVVAYGPNGEMVDLTGKLPTEESPPLKLPPEWQSWTIYSLSEQSNREQVKRPAPGGKGFNINPYNRESAENFLDDFAKRTADLPRGAIRASFHDSFEYEGNWSKSFLTKFAEKRGYRLEEHLPALADQGDRDTIARVKSDYRETMSDLVHDELIVPWVEWAHEHGQLARNQAHGSPGNWLDLYAACDIPETESFGALHTNDANPLVQKFASSAAHVAGRKLVASESATWLDQHFTETLAVVKERLDRQMLAGINHVIYHGTAYSPADAEWPGWLFYASTQLNPQNPIWRDFPALNAYVARCQAMLQAGEPANDLLIYWPIHDLWHNRRGLRKDLRVHNSDQWFLREPIGKAAKELDELGVSFDYISDAQVLRSKVEEGRIKTPGASYQAVLVPDAEFMPVATLEKLNELAKGGAKVLYLKKLPESAPGLLTEDKKQAFVKAIAANSAEVGSDLKSLLKQAGITPEPFRAETPLRSIRRKLDDGWSYLLRNSSDKDFDSFVELIESWKGAALLDALDGSTGTPQIEGQKIRVQIPAGGTIFVRMYDKEVDASPWQYIVPASKPLAVEGSWKVEFIAGGPELPSSFETSKLDSWTKLAGEAGEKFAGTALYTISLTPPDGPGEYLLSLGKVADSARVFLNGKELGVLFTPPFEIPVVLSAGDNELKVEVTNVAINRIRDLDRRKVKWQIFDDINIVGIDFDDGNKYVPLNTAEWPIREAGLLGPVTLMPLAKSGE
jgi:hypothetical protein